ncbi:MAG TPA: NAD(P)H-dependent oxidoreductase, partial [Acidimicrobiales bacterium]|nr:NAD(P)H-dependent oxidoreductase [Acidimicrobiales bacterium]
MSATRRRARALARSPRPWPSAAAAAGLGGAERVTLDLANLGGRLFDWSSAEVKEAVDAIRNCRLVVVASPTFKASYTGLLKSFLDWFGAT